MTPPRTGDAETDRRTETILRDYLAAEDAGAAPSREELLTQHPECRSDLTAYFEATDDLRDCKQFLVAPHLNTAIAADAIPGFHIHEEIGRGGMGVVYRALQPVLNRTVAIKLLRAEDASIAARLLAEARAAARLDHPCIVPIFEVGNHQGRPYLAMAYIAGETLATRAARGPTAGRMAARIVRDVALGVQHAHEQGIIHRDLKPANILITPDGQPRVTDFGLAKRSGEATITAEGQVLGTPAYMPPEFAVGQATQAGPTADVYGLGAILYTLLTGRAPFAGGTPLETIRRVASEEPPPPRQLNPEVPRALQAICLRCLEKQPRHRYVSAREVAEDLDRYLADEVPLAEQLGWRDWFNRKFERAIDFNRARLGAQLYIFTAVAFAIAHAGYWLVTRDATDPVTFWAAFLGTLLLTSGGAFSMAVRLRRLDSHEREVLVFWIAITLGQVVVFANHCPLHGVTSAAEVNRVFAACAALYGVVFFAQGRLYWGRFYQIGLGCFAAALLMITVPDAAPLIHGGWLAAVFAIIARHLHRVARSQSQLGSSP